MSDMTFSSKGVEIPEICTKCGGKCCKNYPGGATPEDFDAPDEKLMYDKILMALKSGRWTIDWEGTGDDKIYFIRPAIKGNEGSIFDHAYEGECTFLTSSGCELNLGERPEACRMLIPKITERCDNQGYTRKRIAFRWKQYQELILNCAVEAEGLEYLV